MAALGASGAGCQVARTEVVVRVESELAWGEGSVVQSVVLTVRRGGATGPMRSQRTTALGRGEGRSVLPMHVGVLETSDDRDTPLWLEARGCAGPNGCSAEEAVVVQRAVVRFVPASRVLVTLLLASACVGVRCGVEELCVPTTARCRPAEEATTVVGTGAWPDAGRGVEDRMNVLDARRPDDAGAVDAPVSHDAADDCGRKPCLHSCPQDFGDCDRDPGNGCEADLRASMAHCGACGVSCQYANAEGRCMDGACLRGTCNMGFGDCDNDPFNGCETNLNADPNHCGACGARGIERCDGMDNDCDGVADEGCPVSFDGLDTYDFVSPSYGSTPGTAFELECPPGTVVTGLNSYLYSNATYPVGFQLRCGQPRIEEDRRTRPFRYTVTLDDAGTTAYQGTQSSFAASIACPADAFAYTISGRFSTYHHQMGFSCARWTLQGDPITGWRVVRVPEGTVRVVGATAGSQFSYLGPLEGQTGSALRGLLGTGGPAIFYQIAARFAAPTLVLRR